MPDAARKKSNASLWWILALCTAPVAASYLLYYFWAPSHTVNYGDLIQPKPLPDATLTLADGKPFRASQLRGKWVLVSVDSGGCDQYCEEKLLFMRQLRLTQGKNTDRVERVWLITDVAAPRPELASRYEGTWFVRAGSSALADSFPGKSAAPDHIYVVDPLGNVMMRFPRNPDPKAMIKDLSRLLKASQVG